MEMLELLEPLHSDLLLIVLIFRQSSEKQDYYTQSSNYSTFICSAVTESILYDSLTIFNMSWDNDVWARMVRDSIEMASNQVKRNIEMASEMASAFNKSSGTLGKETNAAIQKATSEMMASAEKARIEILASVEKARNEMLKEMMESFEKMKMSFSPSNTRRK